MMMMIKWKLTINYSLKPRVKTTTSKHPGSPSNPLQTEDANPEQQQKQGHGGMQLRLNGRNLAPEQAPVGVENRAIWLLACSPGRFGPLALHCVNSQPPIEVSAGSVLHLLLHTPTSSASMSPSCRAAPPVLPPSRWKALTRFWAVRTTRREVGTPKSS